MKKTIAAVLAFSAGGANALFGGGGGTLVVPALNRCLGVEEKRAHATALAVTLPLSLLAGTVLTIKGVWDLLIALSVGCGAMVGGGIGALLLKKTPKGLLTVLFYGVMIYAGIRFLRS